MVSCVHKRAYNATTITYELFLTYSILPNTSNVSINHVTRRPSVAPPHSNNWRADYKNENGLIAIQKKSDPVY